MKPAHSLIYLEWVDSSSADGWHGTRGFDHELIVVRSVGWVQFESDALITIVGNLGWQESDSAFNQACGWMTIPKAVIQRRIELTVTSEDI